MGHIDEAVYFVAPAYLVTFITFGVMGFLMFRRLRTWSRRAQDEDHHEDHPTAE